jgi:hypothetical protein
MDQIAQGNESPKGHQKEAPKEEIHPQEEGPKETRQEGLIL